MSTHPPHVCPWWMGHFLLHPLRRFWHAPAKILAAYVQPGMRVLEVGPGMGFFSLYLAERVGPTGRIVAVDVQEKMLQGLERRLGKVGLRDRVMFRHCASDRLAVSDLDGSIDFVLAFAVIHEVLAPTKLCAELFAVLRPGGTVLVAEPKGHVTRAAFAQTSADFAAAGFQLAAVPSIARSHSLLARKP